MDDNQKRSPQKIELIINRTIKGRVLEIDELGVFVEVQGDFMQGSVADLRFVTEEREINVMGAIKQIRPGKGIEIEFLINLPSEDLSFIRKVLDAQVAPAEIKPSKKKILLVDDSRQLRSAYGNELVKEGFAVTEAQSGTEAFVRLQEATFDLVMLDLGIEGIDGFKVLHGIRSKPATKETPVIIFSARSTPADVEKAMALGATEYLVKTAITPAKLAEKVKEIFSKR